MNRSKIINLFIGNISNSILHQILETAIDDENIRKHYNKELNISLDIAKRYREKINPVHCCLHSNDVEYIKDRIHHRVTSELRLRISKGYKNINLDLIDETINKFLKETNVI